MVFSLFEKLDKSKAQNLNPIVLAFVGDAVYSLFIRTRLSFTSDSKTGALNKLATEKVNAKAQAQFIKDIMPLLSEEEIALFKRARNAKKYSKSKRASNADYHTSTGFAAVLGHL